MAGRASRVGSVRELAWREQPALVILDEPNASLDSDGEAALLATLRSLKAENRTVILITHKTNILAMMDKILVLHQGAMRMVRLKRSQQDIRADEDCHLLAACAVDRLAIDSLIRE